MRSFAHRKSTNTNNDLTSRSFHRDEIPHHRPVKKLCYIVLIFDVISIPRKMNFLTALHWKLSMLTVWMVTFKSWQDSATFSSELPNTFNVVYTLLRILLNSYLGNGDVWYLARRGLINSFSYSLGSRLGTCYSVLTIICWRVRLCFRNMSE